jgi:uncharacterized protein YfaS (alpha-2-macroglobulin family)
MGDRARSRSAFNQAVRSLGYREPDDWYQSPLRDLSAVIALAYESGETGIARGLQGRLENAVKDPDALNTQEQARLLQAAHFMLRVSAARFSNAGTGALWRTVTVTGAPVSAPAASASGITVSKQLFSLGGGAADPAALKQGDRVIVLVSGRSGQARTTALVVDDALPAGFEIETVLGAADAQEGPFKFLGKLSAADVQEARDDRYVAAMELPGREAFAFAYIARAVTPGDFLLPGAEARDMYRPSVSGRTAARRTQIAPGL